MAKERTSPLSMNEIGRIFREGSGRAVATLIRVFGDIDVAEDAVQDAFLIALAEWTEGEVPDNTEAWIYTTARHKAIDRLRRDSLGRALLADVVREHDETEPELLETETFADDSLRLIFTCCHPALAPDAQVALTLRLLGGLATADVARAFLVEESTMAQRIVRAKRKIKAAHIPYRVPAEAELPARLSPVLAVIYLIFNAGAGSAREGETNLRQEALRLGRLVLALLPEEPEVLGLLSLMLFHESRTAARRAADGSLVLLRDQKRCQWNRLEIEEARRLLRTCLVRDDPGPYQLQAAIQAVHADATRIEDTDWSQIVSLYDELLHLTRSSVVALNRAIAVAELEGPEAALSLVDELALEQYYLFHSTRADLLERLGRGAEARVAFLEAAAIAPVEEERKFLRARASATRQ